MTCLERLKAAYPDTWKQLMKAKCPSYFGYAKDPDRCYQNDYCFLCKKCWEKESD